MRSRKLVCPLILLLVLFSFSSCHHHDYSGNVSPDPYQITLMHLNDTHSHLEPSEVTLKADGHIYDVEMGGYPLISSRINEVRAENPNNLLLLAGDAVQGTIYYTTFKGRADFDMLNSIGVDAMCLGNHEFDSGPEALSGFIDMAEFPMLACNIDDRGEPELAGKIESYTIRTVGGEKIGIIGATTPSTKSSSSPGDRLIFSPIEPSVSSVITKLEAMGVNKIFLITHQGYENDLALAKELAGVDVIVGGHSHTLIGDYPEIGLKGEGGYPAILESASGETVLVVQAWSYTKLLPVLTISFDDQGLITSHKDDTQFVVNSTISKDGIKMTAADADDLNHDMVQKGAGITVKNPDPVVSDLLAVYEKDVAAAKEEVVASVSEALPHTRTPCTDPFETGESFPNGSYIAPVVAESMLWKIGQTGTPGDLAMINAGGVRQGIKAGDLTVADVYEMIPFGNTLVVIQLTGKDIADVIQQGVTHSQSSNGSFPYVAGVRFCVDAETDPENPVVSKIELKNIDESWQLLDNEKTYSLVTISYLASGGNGYDLLKDMAQADTGFVDAEAFQGYAKSAGVIGRISPPAVIYKTSDPCL